MKSFITTTEKQTMNLAQTLANNIKTGSVIGLIGDLGAGKTAFAKGFAKGLGIKQVVNSPTFVIMRVYEVKKKDSQIKNFVHIDAYRLKSGKDLIAIGGCDYFNRKDSLVLIEWADNVKKILPKNTLYINFTQLDENSRKITIKKSMV